MSTIKLYDEDAYKTSFSARVLSCSESEITERLQKRLALLTDIPETVKIYSLVLDKTLFFPEEGGQTPDGGTLTICGRDLPVIDVALKNGITMIVDEIDSSINPVLIVGLINLFTNSEINKNGAELIFTTHNPVYLANDLLRRDEIEILEKDENTLTTVGYTIADIKGVRKGESLLKNYLAGKYGPIHEIDFENIIK